MYIILRTTGLIWYAKGLVVFSCNLMLQVKHLKHVEIVELKLEMWIVELIAVLVSWSLAPYWTVNHFTYVHITPANISGNKLL